MDPTTPNGTFVPLRDSTTDSIFLTGPRTVELLMTYDHNDLFAASQEEFFKQHQEILNHELFLLPLTKDSQYLERNIPLITRNGMGYHTPTAHGLVEQNFESLINPIFLNSPFSQQDTNFEDAREDVAPAITQHSTSSVEVESDSSHHSLPPGTIVKYSGQGREKIVGKLRIHRRVYNNPLKIHRQIKQVIVDQLDPSKERVDGPIDGNARRETLRWKPLSIYSAYNAIKGAELHKQSFDSCFGKINMRIKRAWSRRPNRNRRPLPHTIS